jgi:hypothetical protein
MTSPRQNDHPDPVRNAEETLRLIASLPAPDGLAGRVQARLATPPRRGFLSAWSGFGLNGWMYSPALRGCAAAVIVLVVAGGGWRIYSRVQPAGSANNVIVLPARVGTSGGFSNAGAIHKPDTLNGPVLARPALPAQQNVIAPMPSTDQPQTLTPQPKPATHKKKTTAIPVR